MSGIRRIAKYIRHLPILEQFEGLWNILRRPYHLLLGYRGRGVKVNIGGKALVRIPPEYTGLQWEKYEPESVAIFADWVMIHHNPLVLDIGSAIGVYSCIALFINKSADVIAFDSDLSSLVACRRFCQHAEGSRLNLVYGFVSDHSNVFGGLEDQFIAAVDAINGSGLSGDVGTQRYICIQEEIDLPSRCLDDIFLVEQFKGRPILIKCDVEGAEVLVLAGASNFLSELRPFILLSVHLPVLSEFGSSKHQVANFLESRGYHIECIAIDHEEHWWCVPSNVD